MGRHQFWSTLDEAFASQYRTPVEESLERDEGIVAVAPRLRMRRLRFKGAGVVTDRRLLLISSNGEVQSWPAEDLAVQDPAESGIRVRFGGEVVAVLDAGSKQENLTFGEAVAGFVLAPPPVGHGLWRGEVRYIGGHGHQLIPNGLYQLSVHDDATVTVRSQDGTQVASIPGDSVLEIDVAGPGAYTEGGGWAGGGFGVEGAVKGAVMADVLNALTTRRGISTLLRVSSDSTILVFESREVDRDPLAMALGAATQAAARNRASTPPQETVNAEPVDLVGRLERLAKLHSTGALSDSEFAEAKRRLLNDE